MFLFRQCFTSDNPDIAYQSRWYKQSKEKPLQGSLYSTKNDLIRTHNNLNSFSSLPNNKNIHKSSHFYNDRYDDKYLPGEYRSAEVELEKLRQENIQLKQVVKYQIEPLRLRYTQLVQEKEIKDMIIARLETRLGFNVGIVEKPIGSVGHLIPQSISHRK